MEVRHITSKTAAQEMPLDLLARNKDLSESEKIGGVSRHFEAILLRQFLSEAQKPVFGTKSSMPESTQEIYRDMMVNTLADEMSKSGSLGLAKFFQAQLSPPKKNGGAEGVPSP